MTLLPSILFASPEQRESLCKLKANSAAAAVAEYMLEQLLSHSEFFLPNSVDPNAGHIQLAIDYIKANGYPNSTFTQTYGGWNIVISE